MEKATDKQIYFLKNAGIDASHWSKQAASEVIQNLKNRPFNSQATVVKQPQTELIEHRGFKKPVFKKPMDNSSYYVSYAKDLAVALIGMGNDFSVGPMANMTNEDKAMIYMDKAIAMIQKAREAFK